MTVHPRRAVMELFHLKRVHVLVPNERLGNALVERLSTLDILPAQLTEKSLECLLDCLAYFKLTHVPSAKVAVERARELLPTLRGTSLAAIVGNCSRLEDHSVTLQSASLLQEAMKSMTAEDVASLAEAFGRSGMSSPERWTMLAEHVIRNISKFNARELITFLEAVGKCKVVYPDLYAVIERHIQSQPSEAFSSTEIQDVIELFRRANYPVVTLLAVTTERATLGLDSGVESIAGLSPDQTSGVIQAFLANCSRALDTSSISSMNIMLATCEERRVYNEELMTLVCKRVLSMEPQPEPAEALTFLQAALYVARGIASVKRDRSPLNPIIEEGFLAVFDRCVSVVSIEPQRILTLLGIYLQLFPKPKQCNVGKALVQHYLSYDSIDVMESAQMLRFTTVMHSFAQYGGWQALTKHIAVVRMGISRTQPFGLCTIAEALSCLPMSSEVSDTLMTVYHTLSAVKGWRTNVKGKDVVTVLESMQRARLRHTALLLELVSILLQHHSLCSCKELSHAALCIARLNYKELEFFTVTASRVYIHPQCTVSDVCTMLYCFSFVIGYVIKVVQDAFPRLRIAASQATPRDITLALYSFVKLHVTKHEDLSRALCDQAAASIHFFKPKEILSALQSMRELHISHPLLLELIATRVAKEGPHMQKEIYTAIVAALAAGGKSIVTETMQRDFVAAFVPHALQLPWSSLRDVLIALSNFSSCTTKGSETGASLLSDSNLKTLLEAAEKHATSIPQLADVCAMIVALTDLQPNLVQSESPLAARLREDSMAFMELSHFQQPFRVRGLFRLFPSDSGVVTKNAVSTLAAPASMLSMASSGGPQLKPPVEDIGRSLRAFHDNKKIKPGKLKVTAASGSGTKAFRVAVPAKGKTAAKK